MKIKSQAPCKPWGFETNAAQRLKHYRELAQFYYDNYHDASRNSENDWRNFQYRWQNGRHSCTWSEDRSKIFVDSLDDCPFIKIGDARKLVHLDHTGWYADQYCEDTIIGAVVAFRDPHKLFGTDGDANPTHLVYLPATYCTGWDGATIDMSYRYETARDAAYAADRIAEREAKDAREANAKYEAEREIEEKREEIHTINKDFLALAREIKNREFPEHVCGAVKSTLRSLLSSRQQAFRRIAKLQEVL